MQLEEGAILNGTVEMGDKPKAGAQGTKAPAEQPRPDQHPPRKASDQQSLQVSQGKE
jgi:hypothetical protein